LASDALGVLNRQLHGHAHDFLAGETLGLLHLDIDSEEHRIGCQDVGCTQLVFDAHRTLRFHFDAMPERLGGFLGVFRPPYKCGRYRLGRR